MACMKLGSKPDVFLLDGHTWLCSTGLSTDVIAEVGDMSFHLHKFPLLSRSGVLEDLIRQFSGEYEKKCVLQLHDIPGGARAFLLVSTFCYGIKFELNASNAVSLRCAAEYLRMNEDYGDGNLITQTDNFLNELLENWTDSIKALETCEEVLLFAEQLHIVSRCIDSLATKACADPTLLEGKPFWNGIHVLPKPKKLVCEDWWYEDVSFLRLPLYKRLIMEVESRGMKPKSIIGSLIHYAKRHLRLLGRQSSYEIGPTISASSDDADQRKLLEEIVELLPNQKGLIPTNFLLRLLQKSMILHASPMCQENLEKRIGAQLNQVALEDLMIPSMGYSVETLYDIDCVQRILDHFIVLVDDDVTNRISNEEGQLVGSSSSITRMTMVANLVDAYLAEVAPDVNLKLLKFQSLAAAIPDFARPLDDGIYRAVDIYLKAHTWLTDSEKEQICRLVNCQKLSLEASTHAAQNERLPLRFIVQVLFFEQLRLRTSIAGWFFVSDNLDNSQNNIGTLALARNIAPQPGTTQDCIVPVGNMTERVLELEKECMSMKKDLEKMVKRKGGWNMMLKKFGLILKLKSSNQKVSKHLSSLKASPTSTEPLINSRQKVENCDF